MAIRTVRDNTALHAAPPERSASAAQLRYIRRYTNGIERTGKRNFRYRLGGAIVRDQATLARIRHLAIPPAWTDVWICPHENGHLQATGFDVKGRKQYRYHNDWSAVRNETKFAHMQAFGRQLPAMRKRLAADLRRAGLPQEKVLAAVVSIMDRTQIRVGHDTYAKENGSFGLSTLLDRHVKAEGGHVRFVFKGKTGVQHNIKLGSSHLSKLVLRCKDLPGQDLFQYLDGNGEARPIDSGMVNDYIRSVTDGHFTSKDIRTWKGTVHCVRALLAQPTVHTKGDQRTVINAALDEVAHELGNTRAVCRKYYVHPQVIEAYGTATFRTPRGSAVSKSIFTADEQMVLRILAKRPSASVKPPFAKAA
ncbi:MAG: DNA topoisomerase IB [Flavobacteriales bacterium]